jgi:hypothetical protein
MEFKFRKKRYTLKRDAHCFALSELFTNSKTNELEERNTSYYNDINSALKHLFNVHVLDKGAYKTLKEAIDAANRDIKKLLNSELKEIK